MKRDKVLRRAHEFQTATCRIEWREIIHRWNDDGSRVSRKSVGKVYPSEKAAIADLNERHTPDYLGGWSGDGWTTYTLERHLNETR